MAFEIDWQARLWQGDFEGALGAAERVLGALKASELRGYRALWHYLAGSAAWFGAQEGGQGLDTKARAHFAAARNAATGVPWLVALSRFQPDTAATSQPTDPALMDQIERIEAVLADLGTFHDSKFAKQEMRILVGLGNPDTFEEAQKQLGIFVGFSSGNQETEGAPDPWWISGSKCLVFEDYAGADDNSALSVTKARQAESHPKWMRDNVQESVACEIHPVLVGPISRIKKGAVPHAKGFAFWPLSEFQTWAQNAVAVVRSLRTTFVEPGDLVWRAYAAEAIEQNGLSMPQLFSGMHQRAAAEKLEVVD